MYFNDKEKDKPADKGGLDRAAFKHAIGFIESRNGKYLDSKHSSAAGRYHFLYNLIKGDPLLKGVSKRDFINDTELQEQIMDKAIDGKLKGYVGYAQHAKNLKAQFPTDLSVTEVAALTHFLGAGGARKYLRDPQAYKVTGVNATPEKYIEILNKQTKEYYKQNPKTPVVGKAAESGITYTPEAIQAMQKQKDGVITPQHAMRKDIPNIPQGLQFKENTDIDTSVLPDAVSDSPNEAVNDGVIPISEQVQGGTPSNLKVIEDTNTLAQGGHAGPGQPEVIEFNAGGSHEQNPHGGVPIGTGSNGKMNTVEEGETKFGSYVFSDRISLDGTRTDSPASVNKFAEGGDVDPTDPKKRKKTTAGDDRKISDVDPKDQYAASQIEKNFISLGQIPKKSSKTYGIPRYSQSPKFTKDFSHFLESEDKTKRASQDEFVSWFNDPVTRKKIKDQGLMNESQIDDSIVKGISGGIIQSNDMASHADAQYFPESEEIRMQDIHDHEKVQHEMGHRSGFDSSLSGPLMKILGNPHAQDEKKGNLLSRRYLGMDHEAYGNFHEFRLRLGLKPGEKISKEELKKRVEEKGLSNEHFYKVYDDDKIIEAIDKVALQEKPKQQQEYRLA